MLDIDFNDLKSKLKAEIKNELNTSLKSDQDLDLKEKEYHSQYQTNKQINYNNLTQKQIQGQTTDNDADSIAANKTDSSSGALAGAENNTISEAGALAGAEIAADQGKKK
jgi:hypothetical protein